MPINLDVSMVAKEAVAKRMPSAKHALFHDTKVISRACPKCGCDVVCAYFDSGGLDHVDTYAHACLNSNCDYVVIREVPATFTGQVDDSRSAVCLHCERSIKLSWPREEKNKVAKTGDG